MISKKLSGAVAAFMLAGTALGTAAQAQSYQQTPQAAAPQGERVTQYTTQRWNIVEGAGYMHFYSTNDPASVITVRRDGAVFRPYYNQALPAGSREAQGAIREAKTYVEAFRRSTGYTINSGWDISRDVINGIESFAHGRAGGSNLGHTGINVLGQLFQGGAQLAARGAIDQNNITATRFNNFLDAAAQTASRNNDRRQARQNVYEAETDGIARRAEVCRSINYASPRCAEFRPRR